MPRKAAPNPIIQALEAATRSEPDAVFFFEETRWGAHPKCARCDATDVYQMTGRDGKREVNYRWRCRVCGERYTVRTGTIYAETRLPMKVWAHALWRVCASKKGVSALQIHRETEVSYKTALYLLHRIRHAVGVDATFSPPLGGYGKTVEADETYIGGKPRNKGYHPRGRGTCKTPVMAMVERGGDLRYRVMGRVTARTLGEALADNVDPAGRLMTDALRDYCGPGKLFYGGHESVNHTTGEYARGDAHNNTAESAFSLLKRGMYGTFHSVSKVHLHRYLSEFAFRWNTRGMDDGARTAIAAKAAVGKRLTYRRHGESAA